MMIAIITIALYLLHEMNTDRNLAKFKRKFKTQRAMK